MTEKLSEILKEVKISTLKPPCLIRINAYGVTNITIDDIREAVEALEAEIGLWHQEFGSAMAPEVKAKHFAEIAIIEEERDRLKESEDRLCYEYSQIYDELGKEKDRAESAEATVTRLTDTGNGLLDRAIEAEKILDEFRLILNTRNGELIEAEAEVKTLKEQLKDADVQVRINMDHRLMYQKQKSDMESRLAEAKKLPEKWRNQIWIGDAELLVKKCADELEEVLHGTEKDAVELVREVREEREIRMTKGESVMTEGDLKDECKRLCGPTEDSNDEDCRKCWANKIKRLSSSALEKESSD